jgi:PAS domain S-box-containing protein
MTRYRVFQAVSAAILVAGLAAAVILCNTLLTRERREIQTAVETETRHVASQFHAGVLNSVEPLREMGAWWFTQGKPLDLEDWRTDGQLFLSRSPGLRQAAWVGADGLQDWSAAPGSTPIPMHRPPEERVQQLVALARARGEAVMSGIFDLPGGAAGFYVCMPVLNNQRVRGYILGVYDAQALASSLAEKEVRPDSPVSISTDGREIYSAPGGGARWQEERARAEVEILARRWTIALRVPLNAFREFRGLMLAMVSVIGALLYSFAMLLLLAHRRSAQLQRANAALESEVRRRVSSEAEVLALNRDLTRKVADFQTLLDVIPIGIAVAEDPECRIVRPNPALAAFLGVQPGANISKTGLDAASSYRLLRNGEELRPEEVPMRVAAAYKRAVLGEECQVERTDGSVVDALSFASPLFDENGRVRGVLTAYVDITESKSQERMRRELELRFQRAERMRCLGVMAAGIAHDFNNLLTGVIGQASLAAEMLPPTAEAQHPIASSLEAANCAAELVNKVLAYTGQSYHDLRPTDLGDVVRESQPVLLSLAGTKAELRFHIAASLPRALADPDEIRHALYNLVLNAVEAAEPGRNLVDISVDSLELRDRELETTVHGEKLEPGIYVQIEVKDNGAGMPPEIAEKAFDPFFTTKFLGRGLGLSELLGIMRSHNGGVRMETAPGAGTSVKLFFPARLPFDE